MKATAWGARPRTVTPAALLGDRLNNRRPAPICMGRSTPGAGIGRSHSRWPAPGLRDCPPSPRPPVSSSGLQAECERVVGGGLGWRGGVALPPPGGPPRGGSVLFRCVAVRARRTLRLVDSRPASMALTCLRGPLWPDLRGPRVGDRPAHLPGPAERAGGSSSAAAGSFRVAVASSRWPR